MLRASLCCVQGGPDATGRQPPSGSGRESVQVGGTVRTFLALLGARSAAATWRTLDGCRGEPKVQDDPAAADGTRLHREVTSDCDDGVDVKLYTVEGGGHSWRLSGGFGTAATVTSALLEHVTPPSR